MIPTTFTDRLATAKRQGETKRNEAAAEQIKKPPAFTVTCLHCDELTTLTPKQIRSLNGQLNSSLRTTYPAGPPIKCTHPLTPEKMAKCSKCKHREYMRKRRAEEKQPGTNGEEPNA